MGKTPSDIYVYRYVCMYVCISACLVYTLI